MGSVNMSENDVVRFTEAIMGYGAILRKTRITKSDIGRDRYF